MCHVCQGESNQGTSKQRKVESIKLLNAIENKIQTLQQKMHYEHSTDTVLTLLFSSDEMMQMIFFQRYSLWMLFTVGLGLNYHNFIGCVKWWFVLFLETNTSNIVVASMSMLESHANISSVWWRILLKKFNIIEYIKIDIENRINDVICVNIKRNGTKTTKF